MIYGPFGSIQTDTAWTDRMAENRIDMNLYNGDLTAFLKQFALQ